MYLSKCLKKPTTKNSEYLIAYFTLYFIKDWISSSAVLSCMNDKEMNLRKKCLQKKKTSLTFYYAYLVKSFCR